MFCETTRASAELHNEKGFFGCDKNMDVLMQAFHWGRLKFDNVEYDWYGYVKNRIPILKKAGLLFVSGCLI